MKNNPELIFLCDIDLSRECFKERKAKSCPKE
jgi:hypothetical protein